MEFEYTSIQSIEKKQNGDHVLAFRLNQQLIVIVCDGSSGYSDDYASAHIFCKEAESFFNSISKSRDIREDDIYFFIRKIDMDFFKDDKYQCAAAILIAEDNEVFGYSCGDIGIISINENSVTLSNYGQSRLRVGQICSPFKIKECHFNYLILATDGFINSVDEQELKRRFKPLTVQKELSKQLTKEAFSNGANDDLTVGVLFS